MKKSDIYAACAIMCFCLGIIAGLMLGWMIWAGAL